VQAVGRRNYVTGTDEEVHAVNSDNDARLDAADDEELQAMQGSGDVTSRPTAQAVADRELDVMRGGSRPEDADAVAGPIGQSEGDR